MAGADGGDPAGRAPGHRHRGNRRRTAHDHAPGGRTSSCAISRDAPVILVIDTATSFAVVGLGGGSRGGDWADGPGGRVPAPRGAAAPAPRGPPPAAPPPP